MACAEVETENSIVVNVMEATGGVEKIVHATRCLVSLWGTACVMAEPSVTDAETIDPLWRRRRSCKRRAGFRLMPEEPKLSCGTSRLPPRSLQPLAGMRAALPDGKRIMSTYRLYGDRRNRHGKAESLSRELKASGAKVCHQ